MTEASAMSMFAALLDRSFVQIGEFAADGRFFDREQVARIADVWDNNTWPLVGTALCRPAWVRERRARAALRWMAEPGSRRRTWMIEQAASAGHRLEPVLGRPEPDVMHYRDYLGRVQPGVALLTPAGVASVAADYDLAGAEVRTVRVERAGQRLSGHLALTVPRRYPRPSDHADAILQLHLDDVSDARFDSNDGAGAILTTQATGVEVRVGTRGYLRAASTTVTFDDPSWHLSQAGQAADVETPGRSATRRASRRPAPSRLRGAAEDAAFVLHHAMLEIRSVRYATAVGRVPLQELCNAFESAGAGIRAAAAQPRSARDRAFRALAGKWVGGSPHLARIIAGRLPDGHWLHTVSPTGSGRPAVDGIPAQAHLTLAGYTAAHTSYGTLREPVAIINIAVRDDDGWSLRALEFPRPARLTLDTTAFTALNTVTSDPQTSLTIGHGALTVTCRRPDPGNEAGAP